jgi:hypothetical protein
MYLISGALLTWAICFTIYQSLQYGAIPLISHLFILIVLFMGIGQVFFNMKKIKKVKNDK